MPHSIEFIRAFCTCHNMFFEFRIFLLFVAGLSIGYRYTDGALTLEQMNHTIMGIRASCQPRFNITDDIVDEMHNGNIASDNMDFKCFINCLLEQMNIVKRGKLNYRVAVRQINLFMPDEMKELYLHAVEECKDSGDGIADICEYSFSLMDCFSKTSQLFLLP